MTFDSGLAPNPFGRWCTIAVCTPNHCNAKLDKGDWILGHSGISNGYQLIYAMEITEEIMNFNDYYNDNRFQYKKPVLGGKWWQITGDNIYYQDKNGRYTFDINAFHEDKFEKDTKYPKVFISNNFYYFGENSIEKFPKNFPHLIHKGRKFTYLEDEESIERFISWLKKNYTKGRNGNRPTTPVRKPVC